MRYILLHKPAGVLSDRDTDSQVTRIVTRKSDPRFGEPAGGTPRKSVYDVVGSQGYPSNVGLVGRLDCATSGVMVMTDDSVLSKVLRDPPNIANIPPELCQSYLQYKTKVYEMKLLGRRLCPVEGCIGGESEEQMMRQSDIDGKLRQLEAELSEPLSFSRDRFTHAASPPVSLKILNHYQDQSQSRGRPHLGWCVDVRVALVEGKHHQLRRIAKRSALVVLALHRVSVAAILHVESVPTPGDCRWLSPQEVEQLYRGLGIGDCLSCDVPIISEIEPDISTDTN